MFRMHSKINLILIMALEKSSENQQKVSYRFMFTVPVTFYFSLKFKDFLNVYNNREIHIQLIKALNAYTKSKEEGIDQKLKPYHCLTDLAKAWAYI